MLNDYRPLIVPNRNMKRDQKQKQFMGNEVFMNTDENEKIELNVPESCPK